MVPQPLDTRVSLRRLEVFCLVVQEGSVTRAAEHLLVAQPAVSGQLRALEQWVGAKLFVRVGSRLVLTDVGHRVYDWAEETLARSLQMHRDVAGLGEGARGALVVASSMAAGTYLLPPALIALRAQRPETEIVIHVGQPQDALHATETGKADLAIVAWDDRDTPDHLVGEHLHNAEIVLCAATDGPPDGDIVSPGEVAELPHVDIPRDVTFHRMLDLQLRRQGISNRNVLIRLGHAEAIKLAIRDHGMVGFVPRYVVADSLARGEVKTVAVRGVAVHETLWMFRRKGKPASALHEAAVAAVREHLAQATEGTTVSSG